MIQNDRIKIGVITPTTGNQEILEQCYRSVQIAAACAPLGDWMWFAVGDGCIVPNVGESWDTARIYLPESAADAGATPRAIGTAYAIGQGCNVIAFLDDDCRFLPEHLPNALSLINQGAEVVASKRWNVSARTGERMFVDIESDGIGFADTNTIVLAGKAAQFGTTFAWFAEPSGTDRIFWDRLRHSFGTAIAQTGQPTVEYVTSWAPHFNPVGEDGKPIWQPPDPAKFVAEENGHRIALWGKPVWNGQMWVRGYDQKVMVLP
jgi:hypothetical protein